VPWEAGEGGRCPRAFFVQNGSGKIRMVWARAVRQIAEPVPTHRASLAPESRVPALLTNGNHRRIPSFRRS
jgi:hypothetical protein